MEPTYWYKQTNSEPLFPDILWSKPENIRTAGKLLILGGNAHGLMAPGIAYAAASKAGIGTARVLLPDAIRKAIGNSFEEGEFVFSTPSGSFAKTALNQILENLDWADALLLAGDFGRNSETAMLLEQVLEKYSGPITLTQDSLDYFISSVGTLTNREDTVIVTDLARLQKMTKAGMPSLIIQHKMSLQALVGLLNSWSRESKLKLLTYHNGNYIYAEAGKVITTPASKTNSWEIPLAAYITTSRTQHPGKSFEAIASAVYEFVKV